MTFADRNVPREPAVPSHLGENDLLFGVPLGAVSRAMSLAELTARCFGNAAGSQVLRAIPWLPELPESFPLPDVEPLPAWPAAACLHGVPIPVIDSAVSTFRDVVAMYDEGTARRFWEKLPHLPSLEDFEPTMWVPS